MEYYVLANKYPADGEFAMLSYTPDDDMRSWASGEAFSTDPGALPFLQPPPEPVVANIKEGYTGKMLEFWDDPVPLMTQSLYHALKAAGVTTLETYKAEIHHPTSGKVIRNYVAYNVTQVLPAAEAKAPNLFFRCAESVNVILVADSVKRHLEAKGFKTLEFQKPGDIAA